MHEVKEKYCEFLTIYDWFSIDWTREESVSKCTENGRKEEDQLVPLVVLYYIWDVFFSSSSSYFVPLSLSLSFSLFLYFFLSTSECVLVASLSRMCLGPFNCTLKSNRVPFHPWLMQQSTRCISCSNCGLLLIFYSALWADCQWFYSTNCDSA